MDVALLGSSELNKSSKIIVASGEYSARAKAWIIISTGPFTSVARITTHYAMALSATEIHAINTSNIGVAFLELF